MTSYFFFHLKCHVSVKCISILDHQGPINSIVA
jgi:hypothetical protein